ncbi:efflux RND transporter periplasmic adaptor subunit [Aquiflexum sp.]|uniref:efflux RND transporter periplasmic adaptor subunit n=1 Tax=Aquiflexum sp. TaxID=1872584 RepID=UPI003593ECD2
MKSIIIRSKPVFALLLSLLISCDREKNEADQTERQEKTQKVEVVSPQQRSFTAEVLITGTARPNQVVTVHAMEAGMLIQMRKDIGDQVRQGETLAVLENPELEQKQLRLEAETKAKKANFDRLQSTFEKTPALTNIQMLENAEAEYFALLANLEAVKKQLSFLTIRAPFTGIITKRFVDKGALIQSGLNQSNPQALFEIQEINPIRLTLPVPESDAVGLRSGMEVEVSFPELSGQSWMAKISRTSRALDPKSKTMQVEIDLENKDGKIISGMYAKALLKIESRENILSLPVMTKISHKNEDYVLVVDAGTVKRIQVKTGLRNQDYFEVLNTEISKDSQVIISGKSLVSEGQTVATQLKSDL